MIHSQLEEVGRLAKLRSWSRESWPARKRLAAIVVEDEVEMPVMAVEHVERTREIAIEFNVAEVRKPWVSAVRPWLRLGLTSSMRTKMVGAGVSVWPQGRGMRARSRDAGPALSGEDGRPPDEGVPHGFHDLGAKGCRGTDEGVRGSPRIGDDRRDRQ